jgi:hypothetical protein
MLVMVIVVLVGKVDRVTYVGGLSGIWPNKDGKIKILLA